MPQIFLLLRLFVLFNKSFNHNWMLFVGKAQWGNNWNMFHLSLFICKGPPRITIDKSTPTTSRKDIGSTCQAQRYYEECESSKAIPKSISFTSETEYQKQLQSPAQVNYLNVNFKFQR